jgi:S-formylglutathione hydrolase FrmB
VPAPALAVALLAAAGGAGAQEPPSCVERTKPIRIGLEELSSKRSGRLVTLRLRSRAMAGEQVVNVLLPRRYDRSGRTRYRTLYLLHGAGGDNRSWLEKERIRRALGDLPVIAVMPDGSSTEGGRRVNGGYSDWYGREAGSRRPAPAWESYHVRELVPFVDRRFRTVRGAAGRAVAGISMGGTGAMKYAGAHPRTFGYAASFSGGLDNSIAAGRENPCKFGPLPQEAARWRRNNPADLTRNMRGVRLFVRSGDGRPGPFDAQSRPTDPLAALVWETQLAIEAGARAMARRFLAAARRARVSRIDARVYRGSHSHPYWRRELRPFVRWLRRQFLRPATAARTPAPPPRERIARSIVRLPGSVTSVRFPSWTTDGSRILAGATSTRFPGGQLVSFRPDGRGLRCLTCGAWNGPALLKPFALRDDRRVLVRIGEQSPLTPADHGIVECSPSVLRCRSARVVPIVPPAAGDPNVQQDQREYRIAPDGVHVGLTQIRTTATGRPDGVGIFGRLVRRGNAYTVADPRVVASGGELKGFTADGRGVTFARFTGAIEAANPDDVVVDLRTGRERRATRALDWDEDIGYTTNRHRGRGWFVVGSMRGRRMLEVVSRIRRPTFIEHGISAIPFSVYGGRADRLVQPWLVDEFGARGRYLGQPLTPGATRAGWHSRPNFNWRPQGDALVFWQNRVEGRGEGTRVVVTRLKARRPVGPPRPRTSPTPRWAPRLAGYVPRDPRLPRSHRGAVSGRIDIAEGPSSVPGYQSFVQVTYRRYADEPGFVLNGVERADFRRPGLYGGRSLYSADLTVSGRHRGWLRAKDVTIDVGLIRGTIASRLDGRTMRLGPLE